MEIRKNLVDASKYSTKCTYTMNPEFITVHNTYNEATANNEVAYMIRNDNKVSFLIAVDDK
ncbi:N-acetylmuramoyl-L-alanine amidase, partial [Bacillus cereus]|nr:N-acetylmuramoyl-L-alanine amidase [Bacillus cereus]